MGEILDSPSAECMTKDCPSGETMYCCLYMGPAARLRIVANRARGAPGSADAPPATKRIGTAAMREAAPHVPLAKRGEWIS